MQEKVILICAECSSRNYSMKKNSLRKDRIEILKFCKHCNRRTLHKESK